MTRARSIALALTLAMGDRFGSSPVDRDDGAGSREGRAGQQGDDQGGRRAVEESAGGDEEQAVGRCADRDQEGPGVGEEDAVRGLPDRRVLGLRADPAEEVRRGGAGVRAHAEHRLHAGRAGRRAHQDRRAAVLPDQGLQEVGRVGQEVARQASRQRRHVRAARPVVLLAERLQERRHRHDGRRQRGGEGRSRAGTRTGCRSC